MFFVRPPFLIQKIFSSLEWRLKSGESTIFLTFDDGPIPEVTPEVLNILKKYEIKATFFCVGDNIRKYPKIFERIIQEGHSVGNHTFNHIAGWNTDLISYKKNVNECENEFSLHGVHTKLFRPPYGKITQSQIKHLRTQGYKIMMWDVLSYDFHPHVDGEKCLKNTLEYTRHGSIVVFHDNLKSKENVLYALPLYIENCIEKGFAFKTMEMKWN